MVAMVVEQSVPSEQAGAPLWAVCLCTACPTSRWHDHFWASRVLSPPLWRRRGQKQPHFMYSSYVPQVLEECPSRDALDTICSCV